MDCVGVGNGMICGRNGVGDEDALGWDFCIAKVELNRIILNAYMLGHEGIVEHGRVQYDGG